MDSKKPDMGEKNSSGALLHSTTYWKLK